MKTPYITPTAESIALLMEEAILAASGNLRTHNESVEANDPDLLSNRRQNTSSDIWK